jgi:hypothetical protein
MPFVFKDTPQGGGVGQPVVFSSLTTTIAWDRVGYPTDLDGSAPRKPLDPNGNACARSKI